MLAIMRLSVLLSRSFHGIGNVMLAACRRLDMVRVILGVLHTFGVVDCVLAGLERCTARGTPCISSEKLQYRVEGPRGTPTHQIWVFARCLGKLIESGAAFSTAARA